MSSEMVETVAKAICAAYHSNPTCEECEYCKPTGHPDTKVLWQRWLDEAHAAIAALAALTPQFGGDLPDDEGWWWNEDACGVVTCHRFHWGMGRKVLSTIGGLTPQNIGGQWAKATPPVGG